MVRPPVVAGKFYDSDPRTLAHVMGQMVDEGAKKEKALGIISPHAGFVYSGRVAGAVYSRIEMPETFVLLGPNHTGRGKHVSISSEGRWEVPTGEFEVDRELALSIMQHSPVLAEDPTAHAFEHSLEVQLPFIAHFKPEARIVPIIIMDMSADEMQGLGKGIAAAIRDNDRQVVVVASSDMSHYVSDSEAREKDYMAIDRILALDPEGLLETVKREEISMCGCLPSVVMLYAAQELGAAEAELVRYATSGDVSGDKDQVVGYAGMIVK